MRFIILLALALALLIGGSIAAEPKISMNQLNWTQDVSSKIHGITNGTAAQDAVTYSQLMSWEYNIYNVRDYGAMGDNSTNDTAAFNLAIAAANAADTTDHPSCVYIPPGIYSIDAAAISAFESNIYGPEATIQARTTSSNGVINTAGVYHGRSIILDRLIGYGYTGATHQTRYGVGLNVLGATDSCTMIINQVLGFNYGVAFQGDYLGSHLGAVFLKSNVIGYCEIGLLITADNVVSASTQMENSQFDILYMACNNASCIKIWSNHAIVKNNIFNIGVMEIHRDAYEDGVVLTGYTENITENVFNLPFIVTYAGGGNILEMGGSTSNTINFDQFNPITSHAITTTGANEYHFKGVPLRIELTTTTATTLTSGADSMIAWSTQVADVYGVTDGTSFTAPVDGYYHVYGMITTASFAQSAGAPFYVTLYKDGSTNSRQIGATNEVGGTNVLYCPFSAQIYLKKGSYAVVQARKTSGGNVNLGGSADNNWCIFELIN